jgi:hypothetical protein
MTITAEPFGARTVKFGMMTSQTYLQILYEIKVKVKLALCLTKHHAMKTYWGSGGIAPRILDLGTRGMCGQLQAPTALPQGKSPRYPFYRRLGGP